MPTRRSSTMASHLIKCVKNVALYLNIVITMCFYEVVSYYGAMLSLIKILMTIFLVFGGKARMN